MQRLITTLFHRYFRKPILVIGGGPSAWDDLIQLRRSGFQPACVLSANEHGFMQEVYPVDFVVNVDKIHMTKRKPDGSRYRMAEVLRPYGKPIINRHSWADYRLGDWTFDGNTGLTAIAVACALGGNPVVPVGIDLWQTGRHYFHEFHTPTARERRRAAQPPTGALLTNKRVKNLVSFAQGANVRPLSGPLCKEFPKYNPDEVLPYKPVAYRVSALLSPWAHYKAVKDFTFDRGAHDRVQAGAILALTLKEAAAYERRGYVVKTTLANAKEA